MNTNKLRPYKLIPAGYVLSGHRCHYCNAELLPYDYFGRVRRLGKGYGLHVIDHVIPVSGGGTDYDENMVHACYHCNDKKRAKSYMAFVMDYPEAKYRKSIIMQGITTFSDWQLKNMIAFELEQKATMRVILERVAILANLECIEGSETAQEYK